MRPIPKFAKIGFWPRPKFQLISRLLIEVSRSDQYHLQQTKSEIPRSHFPFRGQTLAVMQISREVRFRFPREKKRTLYTPAKNRRKFYLKAVQACMHPHTSASHGEHFSLAHVPACYLVPPQNITGIVPSSRLFPLPPPPRCSNYLRPTPFVGPDSFHVSSSSSSSGPSKSDAVRTKFIKPRAIARLVLPPGVCIPRLLQETRTRTVHKSSRRGPQGCLKRETRAHSDGAEVAGRRNEEARGRKWCGFVSVAC